MVRSHPFEQPVYLLRNRLIDLHGNANATRSVTS